MRLNRNEISADALRGAAAVGFTGRVSPAFDLAADCARLAEIDPPLGRVAASLPPLTPRRSPPGLAGMVWMIIGQQVSIVSARAVWGRLLDKLGGTVDAAGLVGFPDEGYRAAGFSRPKIAYVRALAAATLSGAFDFESLKSMPDDEAVEALLALKGVGRWTAETFLMMGEGRADFFPAGDIALQEAIRWLDNLPSRPDAAATALRAQRWKPYRSAAVHILWAWYLAVKAKERPHLLVPAPETV